ncbi:hypothetical protein C5B96_09600 [Subtercola sp. Z020]|uniref:glycosyl hydrolase family 28 protein n=1 Tax=Subtercola sp. Z020 TaxID=2080582 RepID=UPI000CE799B5|nr:glycosyl hydrolase family 28 protein [Subtercola sp. Z020]PPF82198.1 hypothetical protein C5B96_09600 [Subtercola sp. Z020]
MTRHVAPSGDTTGATDVAAINKALAESGEVVLSGRYFIDEAIIMSSDTTLTLNDAGIRLVDGANDNMLRNSDQIAGGTGNSNLRIVGTGLARFNGNPLSQSGGRGQGLLFQNVTGLTVSGVTLGPMYKMAAMQYGVRGAHWSDIELAQDATTTNQDGIDIGPGCRDIHIDSVRGRTGDDCFSIFAKNTGGNTTAYTNGLSAEDRNVSDIYISNVTVDVGINPVRLQAGDGSRLSRVYVSNFTNTRTTTASVTGGPAGVLQFGSTKYVTAEPAAGELADIYLDGYAGPAAWVIGAESNFSRVSVNNVTLSRDTDAGSGTGENSGAGSGSRTGTTSKAAIIGTAGRVQGFAPTISDITVSRVTVLAAESQADVLSLPPGSSVSSVELVDVAAVPTGAQLSAPVRAIDVSIRRLRFDKQLDIPIDQAAGSLPALGAVTVTVHAEDATKTS